MTVSFRASGIFRTVVELGSPGCESATSVRYSLPLPSPSTARAQPGSPSSWPLLCPSESESSRQSTGPLVAHSSKLKSEPIQLPVSGHGLVAEAPQRVRSVEDRAVREGLEVAAMPQGRAQAGRQRRAGEQRLPHLRTEGVRLIAPPAFF